MGVCVCVCVCVCVSPPLSSFTTDSRLDREVKDRMLYDTLVLINLGACSPKQARQEEKNRLADRLQPRDVRYTHTHTHTHACTHTYTHIHTRGETMTRRQTAAQGAVVWAGLGSMQGRVES